ncbi:phosphate-starvation-inducible PsiE family protein [Desulfonauticus submarinus]
MSIKINISKRFFEAGSDLLHLTIGILLIILGGAFVCQLFYNLKSLLFTKDFAYTTAVILNKVFFALMILEVAHTVVISYQEHIIKPEPFLIIGLIASIRRILALTLNLVETHPTEQEFYMAMIETAVLTFLVLILTIGLMLLKKNTNNN